MPCFEMFANGAVAKLAEEILQAVGAEAGLQLALVHVNLNGGGFARGQLGVEAFRNFDGGANLLV